MLKIGVIGLGIVGEAVKFGMEKLGHEVKCHDIKFPDSKLEHLLDCKIIFVCVPTPMLSDGSCNTTIVEEVIDNFVNLHRNTPRKWEQKVEFAPIIAIKSTVTPGTTDRIIEKYALHSSIHFAFVPEFLRERCAVTDFTENHDLCVIGTYDEHVFETIKKAHGKFPKTFSFLKPKEAEFVKYFNNSFGAMKVVFANSFYEVCKQHDVNYMNVKNAVTNIRHIPDYYLDVNENMRGYAGVCWSKDVPALNKLCEGTKVEFFKKIIEENEKYVKTVFPGMRLKE